MIRVGSRAPGIDGTASCSGGTPPSGSVGRPWIASAAAAARPRRLDAPRGAEDLRAAAPLVSATAVFRVDDRFPDLYAAFLLAMLASSCA